MIDENLPQPDPAWEYYVLWHRLVKAKFKLDELIKYVADSEDPDHGSHEAVNEDITELINFLAATRLPKQ